MISQERTSDDHPHAKLMCYVGWDEVLEAPRVTKEVELVME